MDSAMNRLRSAGRLFWIVAVAAWLFGKPPQVRAEDPKSTVVVTDALDAEAFRRIGSRLIGVEVLLLKEAGSEYELCNERVRELRDFQFLFYREDVECAVDRFWRQRLAAANPTGESLRLPPSRGKTDVELSAERAVAAYKALLAKLPERRKQLDANLKTEFRRLHLKRLPSQFASHD